MRRLHSAIEQAFESTDTKPTVALLNYPKGEEASSVRFVEIYWQAATSQKIPLSSSRTFLVRMKPSIGAEENQGSGSACDLGVEVLVQPSQAAGAKRVHPTG